MWQKSPKPCEEPLLFAHEQAKVEIKLEKEAKAEAKRLAEIAKKDVENKKREVLIYFCSRSETFI